MNSTMSDVARFLIGVFIALMFAVASCFTTVEPVQLDFVIRLLASIMMFLLGIIYNEWARSRRNKDE